MKLIEFLRLRKKQKVRKKSLLNALEYKKGRKQLQKIF